jgi:hypothetical protein
MERYWINAPSTLQRVHHMHRMNVLCDKSDKVTPNCVTVYFTSGDVISAVIPAIYLSKGWK